MTPFAHRLRSSFSAAVFHFRNSRRCCPSPQRQNNIMLAVSTWRGTWIFSRFRFHIWCNPVLTCARALPMFTNCCDNGGDSADCTVDDMACNKKKGSEGHRCKGTLQNPRFQSAFMQLNKKNNALSFCFMLLSPRNLLYPCFENISNETMMWGEARCSKTCKI